MVRWTSILFTTAIPKVGDNFEPLMLAKEIAHTLCRPWRTAVQRDLCGPCRIAQRNFCASKRGFPNKRVCSAHFVDITGRYTPMLYAVCTLCARVYCTQRAHTVCSVRVQCLHRPEMHSGTTVPWLSLLQHALGGVPPNLRPYPPERLRHPEGAAARPLLDGSNYPCHGKGDLRPPPTYF